MMILVTGARGFLGQHLIRQLALQGHKRVRCVVRPGTPADCLEPVLRDSPPIEVELAPVDLHSPAALREVLIGVDIVYHLAASKTGSASVQVANTVVASDHLFRASSEAGISRFVLVSSFAVMGAAAVPKGAVVDESVPLDKHPEHCGPYAFAKHYQETLAWEYANQEGLPLVVVRPGVIYAAGREMLDRRMGKQIASLFFHFGSRNQIPLIHVVNCAEAVALAGTVPDIEGEQFCIVDDDLPTSRELLRRYRQTVASLRVIPIPYRVLRMLSQCNVWYTHRTKGQLPVVYTPHDVDAQWKGHRYSNKKAKERLGWRPKLSMQEGLEAAFDWLAHKDSVGLAST